MNCVPSSEIAAVPTRGCTYVECVGQSRVEADLVAVRSGNLTPRRFVPFGELCHQGRREPVGVNVQEIGRGGLSRADLLRPKRSGPRCRARPRATRR